MSEPDILDRTLQSTNMWLNEFGETIGPDKQRCHHALWAMLFALRDRMPLEEAFYPSAQLPILLQGIFWDGYRPSGKPMRLRTEEEFLAEVNSRIGGIGPLDSEDTERAVSRVLEQHIPAGEIEELKHLLPEDIRKMFNGARKPLQ